MQTTEGRDSPVFLPELHMYFVCAVCPATTGGCVSIPINLLVLTSLCVWLHLLQGYKKKDHYIASQGAFLL